MYTFWVRISCNTHTRTHNNQFIRKCGKRLKHFNWNKLLAKNSWKLCMGTHTPHQVVGVYILLRKEWRAFVFLCILLYSLLDDWGVLMSLKRGWEKNDLLLNTIFFCKVVNCFQLKLKSDSFLFILSNKRILLSLLFCCHAKSFAFFESQSSRAKTRLMPCELLEKYECRVFENIVSISLYNANIDIMREL